MSGGIFGIGTSALLAYQRALDVTGHNIANVATDGYSRQRLELATQTPIQTGIGAIGTGVAAVGIDRSADAFVNANLLQTTSAEAYERTYADIAAPIDDLLGDADAGLTPALQSFFAAVHDVATDPTSTAARQQLLSRGGALVDRFAALQGRIDEQRAATNGSIASTVEEVDEIGTGIAELNREIVAARARSGGEPPNDLLDRREELVRQLSERVSVSTVEQSDGSVNVFVGRGQALVVGFTTQRLTAQPAGPDPTRVEVGFGDGAAFVPVSSLLTGGRLGALLAVRDELIDPASNGLGRVALAVAQSFNETHEAGMDLNGRQGEAFFSVPAPQVLAGRGNAATGSPTLAVTDVSALEASDYEIRFDGAAWSVRRLADGAVVGSAAPNGSLAFDGLSLDLAGVSAEQSGDSFLLRPMRVADRLAVRIGDPRAVAAALPVRAEASASNAGAAAVQDVAVLDPADPALRSAADVTFTGGNFVVGAEIVPLDPSGDTTIDANGWRLVVRGTPADGDVFSVRDNSGAVGDNRNALALAGLADRGTLAGGTATISEGYEAVVADVGVKTQRAKLDSDVQAQLLDHAKSQRESVSGVNLDEEAANLLRYQQAYQAAAQVIATAGTMFDTLLAAVRR
ncbi:MAG TPA: flagellar hook-associated protein FlgK [Gammaproteobacteria bacterium]|nr:flagellar hook-associated protein FlgK [Gammaproteobacteria bacterium]